GGWGCGDDGVCRHPSGQFEQLGVPFALPSTMIEVADLDADGTPDVLGADIDRLGVRYFNAGSLIDSFNLPVDLTGVPAVGDADEDGIPDVLLSTANGLVLTLGTPERTLTQVAF